MFTKPIEQPTHNQLNSIETNVLPGAKGIFFLCTSQERHTIATMRCQNCEPLAFFVIIVCMRLRMRM